MTKLARFDRTKLQLYPFRGFLPVPELRNKPALVRSHQLFPVPRWVQRLTVNSFTVYCVFLSSIRKLVEVKMPQAFKRRSGVRAPDGRWLGIYVAGTAASSVLSGRLVFTDGERWRL
jgi:hypothetical protein